MRHIIKFLIALVLVMPFTASAQESTFSVDESMLGAFNLDVARGTYSDGKLSVVIDEQVIQFIFLSPKFGAGYHTLTEFVSDWAVNNLETTALLAIGNLTAEVVAMVDSYDSMTGELNLTIEVVNIFTMEEVKGGAEIPETFTNASLNFVITKTTLESLFAGFDARIAGTRPDAIPCTPPARQAGRC